MRPAVTAGLTLALFTAPALGAPLTASNELGGGGAPGASGFLYDRLRVGVDTKRVTVDASLLTTSALEAAGLQPPGFVIGTDTELHFDEHVSIVARLQGSPFSTERDSLSVRLPRRALPWRVELLNTRAWLGGQLGVALDTAGDSNTEWSGELSGGPTVFVASPSLGSASSGVTQETPAQVQAQCAGASANRGCSTLAAALKGAATVQQWQAAASATLSKWGTTDFTLSAALFGYVGDPASLSGLPSLRTAALTQAASGGTVLPWRFFVRPEVSRVFGPVIVSVALQGGLLASDGGALWLATTRAQWRLNDTVAVFGTFSGQLADGGVALQGGLGVRLAFGS